MSKSPLNEYMLLSRGQWDEDKSPEQIQAAIDDFYVWYDRLVSEGRLKPGRRLAIGTRVVTRAGVTDGPFAETKEVIGGYWFIMAGSLQEAAAIAAESPCLACGLWYEIRPIELERGSAYRESSETPRRAGGPR
ncbi:MAG TPA: YciI family protein [Steroidobacteraceae bacterium]|nr:YciI family protein [Steroidobacteraceae bacterium]